MSSTSPNNARASALLGEIATLKQQWESNQPGARESLIDAAHELITTLELPSEALSRMGWAEPARAAGCRVAVELGLFQQLKKTGEAGLTAGQLAKQAGADESLISRTMKHLTAMHVVNEKDANTFVPTELSNALTEEKNSSGIKYLYDVAGKSFYYLPEYLKSISYAEPTDITNGPFQYAHKTDLPFFGWLGQSSYLAHFGAYMSAYRFGKPTWVDPGFYPIKQNLVDHFDSASSAPFLVDVGGGQGHDLLELQEKYPSLPGKLVLQDQPDVIAAISESSKATFDAQAHDFFTPQPVKDARAYYLHSVLHDWGDDDCIKILTNLKPALKKGYSKVLLYEIVVSATKPPLAATAMDQLMLVLGAMRERTEGQWRALLEKAGYTVTGIWSFPGVGESLIEAELAE